MKMFAQTTDSGTAMAETAICDECVDVGVISSSEFTQLSYEDCSGNDELQCQHCGVRAPSIDWSKVNKAPVPKMSAGRNYYRGPGVRVHVYNTSMAVYVDGAVQVLVREGDFDADLYERGLVR